MHPCQVHSAGQRAYSGYGLPVLAVVGKQKVLDEKMYQQVQAWKEENACNLARILRNSILTTRDFGEGDWVECKRGVIAGHTVRPDPRGLLEFSARLLD